MDLIDFIIEAKLNGYATGGEGQEVQGENGFRGFEFVKGGYKYQDLYFGFNPFSGRELVWKNSILIWSMSYFGRVKPEDIDTKAVYSLLKQAMSKIDKEYPFRGPESLVLDDYVYTNSQNGKLNHFWGVEKINFRGSNIYQLDYHGGCFEPL